MTGYLCSVKDFVGGFTFSQMIAIAVVVALALVLGILIGEKSGFARKPCNIVLF